MSTAVGKPLSDIASQFGLFECEEAACAIAKQNNNKNVLHFMMFSSIFLNVHSVRSFWSFLCGNLILPLDRHYGYSIVTIADSFYNAPSFSFYKNPCPTRLFSFLAQKIRFSVCNCLRSLLLAEL